MLARTLAAVLLCAGLFCLAQAQVTQTGAGKGTPGGGGAFTPSCTPSTNFLARTSGLTNPQKTNYDNLICGLETDSVGCVTGSEMVALYVLAAPDSTTMLLNLCSASFPLVYHGTPALSMGFSANNGFTGDGSTTYFDTSCILQSCLSGPLTSTAFGGYVVSGRTTANTGVTIGALETGSNASFQPLTTSNLIQYSSVGSSFTTAANAQAKGNWIVSRTSGTATAVYLNSNLTPFASNGADASGGPGSVTSFYISAANSAGGGTPVLFATDQIAFAFIGAGLTAANAKKVADRLNTFATALGINAY